MAMHAEVDGPAGINAAKSGTFKVGGDIKVNRLGFGTMRLSGPGIWGPPVDRAEAIRTLKRLPDLGIDFVDTADSYGPDVAEPLIRETLDQGAARGARRHASAAM